MVEEDSFCPRKLLHNLVDVLIKQDQGSWPKSCFYGSAWQMRRAETQIRARENIFWLQLSRFVVVIDVDVGFDLVFDTISVFYWYAFICRSKVTHIIYITVTLYTHSTSCFWQVGSDKTKEFTATSCTKWYKYVHLERWNLCLFSRTWFITIQVLCINYPQHFKMSCKDLEEFPIDGFLHAPYIWKPGRYELWLFAALPLQKALINIYQYCCRIDFFTCLPYSILKYSLISIQL